MTNPKLSTGINGLGRFGLHLLQYWIENYDEASFSIDYINDDLLTLSVVRQIIEEDKYLRLSRYIHIKDGGIHASLPDGSTHRISYSSKPLQNIPWLGQPKFFFECSGKHTAKTGWEDIATKNTSQVLISATSWTADEIVVYGFNHLARDSKKPGVISYGSCTVNAYVPLAQILHDEYGVLDSDVNVIHNIPTRALGSFDTLERRHCTLQDVAPHLLSFLDEKNFVVNYTLVPYDGVSIIDYRFRLDSKVSEKQVLDFLQNSTDNGTLNKLYKLHEEDSGPSEHKFSSHSAVMIKPSIRMIGDNLYIQAYFDNENSVNRYFDIANYFVGAS